MELMVQNYSFIDQILAGSAKPYHLDDIQEYVEDGITHMVSLTPRPPLVSKYLEDMPILLHHLPVYATPDGTQIDDFIDLMRSLKVNEEKAVIHCEYGQERTGIFLAAYLIEIKNFDYETAIQSIREKRPSSLRTHNARQFLRDRYK